MDVAAVEPELLVPQPCDLVHVLSYFGCTSFVGGLYHYDTVLLFLEVLVPKVP